MDAGAAHHEDESRWIDAALAAGLRRIDATGLPAYQPGHTARGRLWLVTYRALAVGGTFEVVAVSPLLVARVEALLASPMGDVRLEVVARWVAKGGLDA